jgi:hypothetical protein
VFEASAQERGILTSEVKILQLRGSNPASADTHSQGGVFDLGFYHDGQADDLVWLARQMGADATWFREWEDNHHVHGVLTGCPRNDPAEYQIDAVVAGYNGLGYMGQEGPDDGPRPLSGRTWEQGIEWAEGDMALSQDDINKIAAAVWNTKLQYEGVADASAEAHLTNANMRARDLQTTAKPANVWSHAIERDGASYQAGSWLTLAGTASDEARDDVNAVQLAAPERENLVAFAALIGVLGVVLGGALALALVAVLGG